MSQQMEFQTEAKQLLHLMIHSLYSHREVFLRELISNASDALDKLRFEALTNPQLASGSEPAIRVKLDKEAKTVTISDNGIGMTREEVIDNIGTIARSGSKAFLEKMTGDQKADSNLIGQFGVGFYSVFMVAASVKVITKKAGDGAAAVMWESCGESTYTLGDAEKDGHGTDVIISLKDEEAVYAENWQARSLIKKYSDFIAFPIYLPNDKGEEEVVNQTKPLWRRAAAEVTEEQYEEFYQQALGGYGKTLSTLHTNAEGVLEYSSIIFIPATAGFDLFSNERKHGVKLYVKRVFIMDNCKELLPEYLRFVRGVVDSEDLPLNVSREILQQNAVIERISKALVSRILGKLKDLAENEPQVFKEFWKNFGPVLKEGLHTDFENREKLLELIRFQSSMGESADDLVSLKQYVDRMREGQKDIYYITGESREIVEKSPHLEVFKAKSIEVLYLVDPIDEWIVVDIYNYNDKQLKPVNKGGLDLGELGRDEAEKQVKAQTELTGFSGRIKEILSDVVEDVRVTGRLKDSPACLVAGEHAMGAHFEKIMKAMGQEVPATKRILEINADHAIIRNMNARFEKDANAPELAEWTMLLYDGALIAEGHMVSDPLAYSKRVNNMLAKISEAG
ncbi:MAG: molecular chaperone HtpG [Chitinispirillia bacterium]|nr:molecular chaperone HtpG [Chitinispirillia bacterium]MCL2242430.1 molecular chaperone HtpG [Chitinispirillia bacterium]